MMMILIDQPTIQEGVSEEEAKTKDMEEIEMKRESILEKDKIYTDKEVRFKEEIKEE